MITMFYNTRTTPEKLTQEREELSVDVESVPKERLDFFRLDPHVELDDGQLFVTVFDQKS